MAFILILLDFYLSEGQQIKTHCPSPWKLAGLCPFHDDHRAGSFYINDTSGGYNCYACENSGGDIIAFTQMKYGLSFVEAVRKLTRQWGVYG
jgi:DNA primase